MKFSYKFSNLLGTVYRKGNLVFSPDGNSVYSPVGNRVTVYDLKNNKSQTLNIDNRFNYESLDISPNGLLLAAVNEEGEAHLISMMSKMIVHKYRFNRTVPAIKFSPNGKYLAVLKETSVLIFKVPGSFDGEFNSFEMVKGFHHAHDDTVCVDWTSDSRIIAIGSKDMTVRIYCLQKIPNFRIFSLRSHKEKIISCFFEKDSLDITSISSDGQLCVWEFSADLDQLSSWSSPKKSKKKQDNSDSEDDVDEQKSERNHEELDKSNLHESEEEEEGSESDGDSKKKLFYKRLSKHNLCSTLKREDPHAALTSAAYHKDTHVLVTGYSTGVFFLHELPSVTMIHSLSISEHEITTVGFNNTGDWIALASSTLGQLLVWEWQSETYVMKQQGHINNMTCLSYSPDGMYVVTGGIDGKVKLWNTSSGYCFVTFTEHSNNVTAVKFGPNRKFIVSASLDGTVRAFDMLRYRNFKTFTSPTPVQFSCLAVDSNGEFIAAGGQDVFEVYLWSLKIGRLCEILGGHEGPVVSVEFSPTPGSTSLASVSWDKTLRLWNAVETTQDNEVITLGSDALAVAFRPDGEEVAVATLDGQISFFNVKDRLQTGCIEGRNDLGSGVSQTDLISAKKSLSAKAFTTLCYTADGSCILAGGQSKHVCIYNVKEAMLLKKFEITQNRSLDNVDDFINRRKMTEFGNLALIEEREEGKVKIRLPGVRQGDMASRAMKPEVRVFCLEFSPTGQAWAAATTEGLLIYSLDMALVFDPLKVSISITPETMKETLAQEDYAKALMMAIKLGEKHLVQNVIESVPYSNIELCVTSIAQVYVVRCLKFIVLLLEQSRHLEFYLTWIRHILTIHGAKVKGPDFLPVLLSLQKNLNKNLDGLGKICDFNKYTMEFLLRIGKLKSQLKMECVEQGNEESEEELMAISGQINTLDELTVVMRSLGMSPTIGELNTYLKNKGGKMTFADFLDVMHIHSQAEDLPKEVIEAFKAIDMDKKGLISARHLRHLLLHWGEKLSQKEVDQIFREANININGMVRYEDFVKIACAPVPDYY